MWHRWAQLTSHEHKMMHSNKIKSYFSRPQSVFLANIILYTWFSTYGMQATGACAGVLSKWKIKNKQPVSEMLISSYYAPSPWVEVWWPPSVHLSVPCLILSWECKLTGHWQEGRPWHRWLVIPFTGRKVRKGKDLRGGSHTSCCTACVFYKVINVQWTISVLWLASWKLWVADNSSHHLYGAGAVPLQATQLV